MPRSYRFNALRVRARLYPARAPRLDAAPYLRPVARAAHALAGQPCCRCLTLRRAVLVGYWLALLAVNDFFLRTARSFAPLPGFNALTLIAPLRCNTLPVQRSCTLPRCPAPHYVRR